MVIEHDVNAPTGTVVYSAEWILDTQDDPLAGSNGTSYWSTQEEAYDALRDQVDEIKERWPVEDETERWCGWVTSGTFEQDEDAPWYLPPSFEPDPDSALDPLYIRHEDCA